MYEGVGAIAYALGAIKEKIEPSTTPEQIASSVLAMGGSVASTDSVPDFVKDGWKLYCEGKIEAQ